MGYVVKSSAATELIEAVRSAASHRTYVSPAVADVVTSALTAHERSIKRPGHTPLSTQEREVLQLLAEGVSSNRALRAGALRLQSG